MIGEFSKLLGIKESCTLIKDERLIFAADVAIGVSSIYDENYIDFFTTNL